MKKTIRYEITVGIFVLAAAAILGYVSLTISRMRVSDGIDVRFVFRDACGLVEDASVRVAGVEVGYVKTITLDSGKAVVTGRISRTAHLGKNVRATVRAKSLLGEKFLELIPGPPGAPPLGDGDIVTDTESPVQIDQTIARIGSILQGVDPNAAARLLQSLSSDPEAARRIVKNLDLVLSRLSTVDEKKLKEFADGVRIRARLF